METETYSGQIWHTFSSGLGHEIDVDVACKRLVESNLFSVALTSTGDLFYISENRCTKDSLQINMDLGRTGLRVEGHNGFLDSDQEIFTLMSFKRSLSLLLSQRKAFNAEFGFPCKSAWLFMEPILIKAEQEEDYQILIPYLTIHLDGAFQLTLAPLFGFTDASAKTVIKYYVNRVQRNISSVLVSPGFARDAFLIYKRGLSWKQRVIHRRQLSELCNKFASDTRTVEIDEDVSIVVTELLDNDEMSLTDVARNILHRSASIALGPKKYSGCIFAKTEESLLNSPWSGKPIVYIESCSKKSESLADAVRDNDKFIKSILHRVEGAKWNPDLVDYRALNDYAHFYSPSVSLAFCSNEIVEFINAQRESTYDFDNVICDVQILNEAAQYITLFYNRKLFELESLKDAVAVSKMKLEIAIFEDRLISSSRQSGEVFNFIDSVLHEPMLSSSRQVLSQKITTSERSHELSEKSLSDARSWRLTILFGIIASTTLTPVLVNPILNYLDVLDGYSKDISSVIGVAVSMVLVSAVAWLASVTAKR